MTQYHLITKNKFPVTFQFIGGKWVRFTAPLTLSLILGSVTTCMVARLRGNKDDAYNYFFGWPIVSLIWTAKYKSSGLGFGMGCAFTVMACILKNVEIQEGVLDWTSIPRGRYEENGAYGGLNWGDTRWILPQASYNDPGRRPLE